MLYDIPPKKLFIQIMFENLDQNSLSSAADPKELIIFSAFYSQVQKTEWVSDAKTFLFSCRRPN
jgi:hypothetical protein